MKKLKRFNCRVQVGDEYINLVERGYDINEIREKLIAKYSRVDRVLDIQDREHKRDYDGSYVGSSLGNLM